MTISEERRMELDKIVEQKRYYFENTVIGPANLRILLAHRLTSSSKNYGLQNGDETAYFFMRMIDPNYSILEMYEIFNKIDEFKQTFVKKFHYFDSVLLKFEKISNARFNIFQENELWVRAQTK